MRRLSQLETATKVARVVAIVLALVMIQYFVTSDAIRSDNAFLLPDLVLTALLLGTALLPRKWAAVSMPFAFAWSAAVWTVSLCTYAVRGEFSDGVNHFALIIPAVALAALLLLALSNRTPATRA